MRTPKHFGTIGALATSNRGRTRHSVRADLIRKIIKGKLKGEAVARELVFVDDFVRIMLELADTRSNDLMNIGAGEEFTIRDFPQLICQKVGYSFESIQFDTTRNVGARSKCLRIDRLRSLFPKLKFTPLEAGLDKTIEWLLQEQAALFLAQTSS